MTAKEALWSKQNAALRHPSEIFGAGFETAGITRDTLKFKASPGFVALLQKLDITLFATREYENLIIALNVAGGKKLKQTFLHLPHPSGIAVDRKKSALYVAATRNPNQIIELKVSEGFLSRPKHGKPTEKVMMPARAKYYPGEYYFHDLVIGNGELYANSVGLNSVLRIDMDSPSPEKPLWWPKCIDVKGKPNTKANYIQLNSIAFGKNLESSFFSASGAKISSRRPGHANYPVDKQGVIFSGATGEPVGFGLTRPHGARLHKGKVWVANSGYGEAGYIENEVFKPVFKFNGWTRGLCFIDNILFVGVSRVLPRFRQYAPGIKSAAQDCGIVAVDVASGKVIGNVKFPFGNQIFGIDFIKGSKCGGLPFGGLQKTSAEKKIFSVSLV